MRRIVLIATALGVLVAAASAYAAINTYSGSRLAFTSNKAGSASNPVPLGYTQIINASGTNGNRTAVLLDVRTKIYGVIADGKDFPTCSATKIAAAQNDTVCPKLSKVATGSITSTLGSEKDFTAAGQACDPVLDVFNGGPGKLVFFFVETPAHPCLGGALHTGQVGPYPGTVKKSGKYLIVDVQVPGYVSFPLGATGGLAGSLETEHLNWLKVTRKVHGKTVAATASVACQKGKRPYSQTFTATLPTTGAKEVGTVSGSAPC